MADNSEQKIIRGKQAIDAVKAKKNATLDEINNIRQALRVLKGDVENFHENCNVARTVGTTTSVVGAGLTIVGCVGALFTGGASLLATSVLGTAYTAIGATVNVTTDVINKNETQEYIETINNKVSGLQRSFEELENELEEVKETITWMMKSYGLDENTALYLLSNVYKFKGDDQFKKAALLIGKGSHAFHAAGELSQTINTVVSIGTFTKTASGSMSYVITKPLSQVTNAELQAIRNFTPFAKGTVSVGVKLFQGGFALVGAGIVVWDIVSLVKNWKSSTHPAVQAIDKVFNKLNLLEKHIREVLYYIDMISSYNN